MSDLLKENRNLVQNFFDEAFENNNMPTKIKLPIDDIDYVEWIEGMVKKSRPDLYDQLNQRLNGLKSVVVTKEEKKFNSTPLNQTSEFDVDELMKELSIDASDFSNLKTAKENGIVPASKSAGTMRIIPNDLVNFKVLECHGKNFLPIRAHESDTGLDCYAFIVNNNEPANLEIKPRSRANVKLGFSMQLHKENFSQLIDGKVFVYQLAAQIRPKSGMAKKGIDVHLGTLDNLWNNQCEAIVINNSDEVLTIQFGEKVCQLCFELVPLIDYTFEVFTTTDESVLNGSSRGGFGSTGNGLS